MGREIVRGFLKEGAKISAPDVSWAPSGVSNDTEDFFAEIKDNPNVLAATMDITIQAHVDFVYKQAMEKFGNIDVIICNGGTRQRDLYHETHGSVTVLETEVGREGGELGIEAGPFAFGSRSGAHDHRRGEG